MTFSRVLRISGISLVGVGVLVLLFVAFQLWGTGIFQSQHQAALRNQLYSVLRKESGISRPPVVSTARGESGVRPAAAIARPALAEPIGSINIARIGLSQVIVQGVGESELSLGPGHYPGTPLPGEAGNAAIAGHRTTWGHPFYNLNELRRGDRIVITTVQGTFTYEMISEKVVSPSDVAVLAPTARPELTLTTCNPRFSATQRLVVTARLESSVSNNPATSPKKSVAPSVNGGRDNLAATASSWVAALWRGLVVLAVVLLLVLVRRRIRPRAIRWMIYGMGTAGFCVLLFFFFSSISLLLPPSF